MTSTTSGAALPLHATGVTLTYPGASTPAITDVDVRVHAGEIVALLGPNGAGKTTFINTVTGLMAPDSGLVRVAGGDPVRATTRLALGVMLQRTAFPTHLTVAELAVGAAVRSGVDRRAAHDVLAEVGLTDLAGRRATQLSGGQARRLQLARALVADPALLVLDEPTEGLDADARSAFWRNLQARRDAGMAVLLTTHLIAEAGQIADRVTVIAGGRVVADADPRTLSDRMGDRRIRLRTSVPAARIRAMDGVLDVAHTGPPYIVDAATDATTTDATTDATTTTTSGPTDQDGPPLLQIVCARPEPIVRLLLAEDPDASDLRVEGADLEEAVMALSRQPAPAPADEDPRADLAATPTDLATTPTDLAATPTDLATTPTDLETIR